MSTLKPVSIINMKSMFLSHTGAGTKYLTTAIHRVCHGELCEVAGHPSQEAERTNANVSSTSSFLFPGGHQPRPGWVFSPKLSFSGNALKVILNPVRLTRLTTTVAVN